MTISGHLARRQVLEVALLVQEFLEGAPLGDSPVFEDQDAIRISNRAGDGR